MKSEAVARAQQSPATREIVSAEDFTREMLKWSDRIAKRAYQLFEKRGFELGHDLEDWFAAERELLKPVKIEVEESANEITVRADVRGFEEKDLEIKVNGCRLAIEGKRESIREQKGKGDKLAMTERKSQQLFRIVDLPSPVLADKAKAQLKNGVLELSLPKAQKDSSIKITAA